MGLVLCEMREQCLTNMVMPAPPPISVGTSCESEVYLVENRISSLIIPHMENLQRIIASNNEIIEVDLSQNPQLTSLVLSRNNSLEEIDLSTLINLTNFSCSSCNLNSLDISNNELLEISSETNLNLFLSYFNIDINKPWENNKYLLLPNDNYNWMEKNEVSKEELSILKTKWINNILKIKKDRTKPRIDDKIIISWNALAIIGLVDAYEAYLTSNFVHGLYKSSEKQKWIDLSSKPISKYLGNQN